MIVTLAEVRLASATNSSAKDSAAGGLVEEAPSACDGRSSLPDSRTSSTSPISSALRVGSMPATARPPARYSSIRRSTFSTSVFASCPRRDSVAASRIFASELCFSRRRVSTTFSESSLGSSSFLSSVSASSCLCSWPWPASRRGPRSSGQRICPTAPC